jgi:hypothetical protein
MEDYRTRCAQARVPCTPIFVGSFEFSRESGMVGLVTKYAGSFSIDFDI